MMEEATCPATPPLSTCSATPPRTHTPKTSPSQWTEPTNNKTEAPPSPSGSRPSSPENCAICLGSLTNKSFTNSCLHQFCFVCLLEWSKVKAECPLCKVAFNSIIHNVRSQDDYDQYHVKQTPRASSIWSSLPFSRNFRYRTTVTYHEFSHWVAHRTFPQVSSAVSIHEAIPSRQIPNSTFTRPRHTAGTSDFRRSVYSQDLWARLQPDVTGRYRECSPEFYRQNPAQLHRLIPFLNRELNVVLENGSRTAYVMERILELIPQYSMTSSEFRIRVGSFIGNQHVAHFCHELRAYASSPYDIVGYDRSVQYHPPATSNFTDEVNEISSPSISNHSAQDSDSESDIQIIDSSLEPPAPTSFSQRNASTSIVAQSSVGSERNIPLSPSYCPLSPTYNPLSPQPGPSGLSTRSNNLSTVHTITSSSVVDVSSSNEDDETDEVQIVGYVKPRHERTPEIITLSSPDHTSVAENEVTLPACTVDPAHDSSDDLICINLGSNSTVSHHLSWNDQFDDISSDEAFMAARELSQARMSGAGLLKNKRRAKAANVDLSSSSWSSSSPSRISSGEEWTHSSKRKATQKCVKKQNTSLLSSKSKPSKIDSSSESENEAHSSSSHQRHDRRTKNCHSRPSKSKQKCSESVVRHHSSHGRLKKKRHEDHQTPSKLKKRESDSEEDAQASTSRGKPKRSDNLSHFSSRSKKYSKSCHHSRVPSSHSSGGSSSRFRSPKLRSIVMTRTTSHEGQELWSVSRNQDSPETFRSENGAHRSSCSRSVVSVKSSSSHSPQSERLLDLSPARRSRHRRDSDSSSSNKRRKVSKTTKETREFDTEKCKSKIRNRSGDGPRSKSSKLKPRDISDRDSDSY